MASPKSGARWATLRADKMYNILLPNGVLPE